MKFQVGEIAIMACPSGVEIDPESLKYIGTECEVLMVGPLKKGQRLQLDGETRNVTEDDDYVVRLCDGMCVTTMETALRKRPQRGIPQEVLRIFEAPVAA